GELIGRITHKLNHLGGTLDPHTCFLLQRGMKTLALRVRCQNRSALQIARFLRTHPAIQEVNYPGLEDHPSHPVARELLDGFGGMLSFDLRGGLEAAERMMKGVHIPVIAPSLGGVESLMTRPALTSHAGLTPEARQTIGIGDGLIRMSVGIEDVDELIADLKQALDKV
ncbi:MAG: PLP-dependent transferase, partial [Calditrichaeota bacterium]|nr:PLP-dependent transferase [Calditrichota bacterium]